MAVGEPNWAFAFREPHDFLPAADIAMPYLLLTGATGLLGTYLLRDLLCVGRQVAVVVRPGRMESARQRVESLLAFWERRLGYALPRPPVLEGDICQADLGLDPAAVQWISENCTAVLHNAASLSFEADQRTGEPYRSNVEGTRNVLELCRKTGIRQFHHVSTAYVCGLRTGRVLESELDVGQESGNDYEKSKVRAEKMVREADFLDPPTIYRPAIIIGDSNTGYTTTFHGFYTPLKIGQGLIMRFGITEVYAEPLMAALGLTGQERKNLVPVDWISRVITYLYGRPEHHGRTYHITPTRPTPATTLCAVLEQALSELVKTCSRAESTVPELAELKKTFISQMGVYQAYWRDDPVFDCTNTMQAAPQLPCPEVGFDMLLCTSRFALEANFGWPRSPSVRPEFDVLEHLGAVLPIQASIGQPRPELFRVGMQVNGPGGGQWTLLADGSRPVAAEPGLAANCQAFLYLNSKTYRQCVQGNLTAHQAARLGHLTAEGNPSSRRQLLDVLQAAVAENASGKVLAVSAGTNGTKRVNSHGGTRPEH